MSISSGLRKSVPPAIKRRRVPGKAGEPMEKAGMASLALGPEKGTDGGCMAQSLPSMESPARRAKTDVISLPGRETSLLMASAGREIPAGAMHPAPSTSHTRIRKQSR